MNLVDIKLERKMKETVDTAHFGFRKGLETSNETFMLRTVMERPNKKQKVLYKSFIKYEKGFDTYIYIYIYIYLNTHNCVNFEVVHAKILS